MSSVEKRMDKSPDRFDIAQFLADTLVTTLETAHEIQKKTKAERRKTDEISQFAFRDHLTGLYNRRALEEFYDRLRVEAPQPSGPHRRANEAGGPSTLIVLDLDRFKEVNDAHGHKRGDEVLKKVSANMLKRARATDLAGRWGGEEFALVLPHTDEKAGEIVAEDIRSLIENEGEVTASFGVAEISPDDLIKYSLDEMMVRADIALYEAKDGGRNQVVCYSQSLSNTSKTLE